MNFQVTEAEFYEQIGRLYVLTQKLEQANAVLGAKVQELETSDGDGPMPRDLRHQPVALTEDTDFSVAVDQ